MKRVTFYILLFLNIGILHAQNSDFVLPSIISDHAVMQRDAKVKLWGWCPSVWNLKIVCSWDPVDTIQVHSDKYCAWETYIQTPSDAGPYTISFYGWKNALVAQVNDILMGETWLCSGQSNMEYNLSYRISDADNLQKLMDNKQIRLFKVNKCSSKYPLERIEGKWEICSSESGKDFSAVGFFFGNQLNKILKVPVGLIGSYWGGTAIQPWICDSIYKSSFDLVQKSHKLKADWAPTANSSIFNGMIFPIRNYTIAGVIWYQGEANNQEPLDYGDLFSGMIDGWRSSFNSCLPFYYVQIAPWNGYTDRNAAYLREQQAKVETSKDSAGMIVINDLVNDVAELHPDRKAQVGARLANMALRKTYHKNEIEPFFPTLKSIEYKNGKALISTTSLGRLICREKSISNFEIIDQGGKIHDGKARILRDGTICVSAQNVKRIVAVRYCFTNDAVANLFDINGLPLAPFRTDIEK